MSTCIICTGTLNSNGYGQSKLTIARGTRTTILAHHLAWEQVHGPLPPGAWLLHSCDVPACINPDHLRIGTHADNMEDRSERGRHRNQRVTHCPNSHEYTEDNTYRWAPKWSRVCKTCRSDRNRMKQATA